MIDNKTIRQVVINKALLPCTPGELEYHEAATAAGGYSVSFTTNVEGAVQDFVTTIVPKQSGTGDPSPDNVRPISGTDTFSFLHSIIQNPPSAPTVINIPLGQTVYGGEVDIDGGILTITHIINTFDGDSITQLGTTGGITYARVLASDYSTGRNMDNLCNCYKPVTTATDLGIYWIASGQKVVRIYDNRFTDLETAQALLNELPVVLCYPLATPVTAQITPVTVNTLKGQQKIENSKKFGFSLKYPIMVGGSCEISKQFLPIFYPNGKGVKHHGSTF